MKNWHRDAPKPPVMPYNTFISNQLMTEEQILQLAENHLTLEKWEDICWKADTLQLLKFARELYDEGYTKGFKVGHDAGWELNDEVSRRGL